ncbi:TrkA C-terminal domain-containing protein, partial [Klebsiella pneumoniae]|uniref:TrkA C-terminal domain-containing protein n=1 Tax=Klebsiella pneumoniae TaxID=573 RepID=UPI003A899578
SSVVGQTVKALDIHGKYGVTVIEVRRTHSERGALLKRVEQYAVADVQLAVGDVLYVTGPSEGAALFASANRLE